MTGVQISYNRTGNGVDEGVAVDFLQLTPPPGHSPGQLLDSPPVFFANRQAESSPTTGTFPLPPFLNEPPRDKTNDQRSSPSFVIKPFPLSIVHNPMSPLIQGGLVSHQFGQSQSMPQSQPQAQSAGPSNQSHMGTATLSVERRNIRGQTMVLNQFTRRQFKRREGTGRMTTQRLISFDSLLLSGKKPVPPTSSSLYQNISTTLKENVDPESRISQNVDDFWAVERQKRVSAVARRKLTGAKEITQDINQHPFEDRRTRHARSCRAGGRRTLGAKPKKLDVYIDADLIADWDKENLEVEEEKPCTIASSEAFMSAQETALRASLPRLNRMDHLVEASRSSCSPIVKTTHTQVEACSVDGEPKEQTSWHDDQANDVKSSSDMDMDLSSGESPDYLNQNICNPDDCTPDLASLVELDWNTTFAKVASKNILSSQGSPQYRMQDAAGITLDAKRETFSPGVGVSPGKQRRDCLIIESQADHCSPVSNTILRSRRNEHGGRVNENQGCINSLMQKNLDKVASCDGTPLHDTTSKRTRLPMTSPTPPANPLAVYLSRRQLSNEIRDFGQTRLAFGTSSSSSSLDIGEDCQNEEIPDTESIIEEPQEATELEASLPVDMEENSSLPCASLQSEPDVIATETQTCANLQSQPDEITADMVHFASPQSQADNFAAEKLQSEPLRQSHDNFAAEKLQAKPLQQSQDNFEAEKLQPAPLQQSQDNLAEKLQPEPLQQSQAKKSRRRKAQDRRSSLEGSENGLAWKDGLRRSQRRRVRPLQWWRGEKLLYGRVHDSLTTVIGIKQSSPGQYARGIKAPFVIESFVPAKYNDLVRFAAI